MIKLAEACLQSKLRMFALSISGAALVACLLYLMNWYSYYDSMRVIKESQQAAYVQQMVAVGRLANGDVRADAEYQNIVSELIEQMRGHVRVTRGDLKDPDWTLEKQGWALDESRTTVETATNLGQYDPALSDVNVVIMDDNRPPFHIALGRAVSLSAPDLFDDPQRWVKHRLVFRSLPFWTPFLIVSLFGYSALYWIARAARYRARLIETKVEQFAARVSDMQDELRNREDRIHQEELLRDELQQELKSSESDLSGRLAEVKDELEHRDSQIDELKRDKSAYEELLREAETHSQKYSVEAEQLGKRLIGRFGDLGRVEQWIAKLDSARANSAQVSREDPKFARLQKQLARWLVSKKDGPNESWSEHSRWTVVRDAYQRIDNDVRTGLFVMVRNGEYRDGKQKSIRVRQIPESEDQGDLEVVLDDDAGRTLCLRFQLKPKKGVPSVERIGFALAVLIRAACKDFDSFTIR